MVYKDDGSTICIMNSFMADHFIELGFKLQNENNVQIETGNGIIELNKFIELPIFHSNIIDNTKFYITDMINVPILISQDIIQNVLNIIPIKYYKSLNSGYFITKGKMNRIEGFDDEYDKIDFNHQKVYDYITKNYAKYKGKKCKSIPNDLLFEVYNKMRDEIKQDLIESNTNINWLNEQFYHLNEENDRTMLKLRKKDH